MPRVVRVGTPGAKYIGRGDKWGNRYRIGRDGTRADVIVKHKRDLANNDELFDALDELKGQDLGCFCEPEPCHGDILLLLANASPEARARWRERWRS